MKSTLGYLILLEKGRFANLILKEYHIQL